MAMDDDELIRKFRALTWRPPWPIGVVVTPQMHDAFDWLARHRDERNTDAYCDVQDWLAKQMGLSPDTLTPLSSRALQIKNNPFPSSAPAKSPPTEHTAEPTAEPPKAEPAPEVETAPEPESEPPSASEPITEPEGGGESVTQVESATDVEPEVESELTVEPKVGPAELTAEPEPRDEVELETSAPETSAVETPEPESHGRKRRSELNTIHRTMKLDEATIVKIKGTSLDSAAEMDKLVILNRDAEEGGLTDTVKRLVEEAVAGKDVSAVGLGLGPSKKRRKPGAGAKQKLTQKYVIALRQALRQAIERDPLLAKYDAAIAELKQSLVPALEERDGVKLAVSNSTLYRRVTLPVLGPRRPK
jgi:hypothetical protein